jgi:hypothetical protein
MMTKCNYVFLSAMPYSAIHKFPINLSHLQKLGAKIKKHFFHAQQKSNTPFLEYEDRNDNRID